MNASTVSRSFLSIQAQDFIEEAGCKWRGVDTVPFLSIQAQDFIEESFKPLVIISAALIPEHSSSGLH